MNNIAIKAEKISKAYQLGEIGTGTISRDLERWWARLRGKEDPFLLIGESNDRTSRGASDVVWSLKDISFEIHQGDAVGIIGRNGAGKSTLLKILSRVTSPTGGILSGKGRIASLLEVGTGFHPELTGRENIFLNGAILGMKRKEITKKFDEIVEFSGVERYIDTPVKRYSSGMYVRLAFAVAAHLESEILIVDEVLAVGDAEFQKKCLGKMDDVSKGEGRTVLFVSHNMGAVKQLCSKGILLDQGKIIESGGVEKVIVKYLNPDSNNKEVMLDNFIGTLTNNIKFTNVTILNNTSQNQDLLPTDEILIIAEFECTCNTDAFRTSVTVTKEGVRVFTTHDLLIPESLTTGKFRSEFKIPSNLLRPGMYFLSLGGHDGSYLATGTQWLFANDVTSFYVVEEYSQSNDFANEGLINIPFSGSKTQIYKYDN